MWGTKCDRLAVRGSGFLRAIHLPKVGGLTPHPPYIYGCHEVRPALAKQTKTRKS
jgi:hypothetical protein